MDGWPPVSYCVPDCVPVRTGGRLVGALCALLVLAAALAAPLRAQVPDTARTDTTVADTTAAPDTTRGAPDSLRARRQRSRAPRDTLVTPLPFLRVLRGRPVGPARPVRHPRPDMTRLLADAPGAFLFDLGGTGWPHGWSWNGFGPDRPALVFDGHPYDDPVTGRPRFDLLPAEFLQAPRVGPDRLGGPVAVYAEPRPYDAERPLTELRYRRNNASVQSVGVAHAQQRYITPFGRPSLFQIVGGYYGRAGDNEYPNSALRRERRLFGRLHLRGARWSATLRNLHSRRSIGAHGGVQPQGGVFETIYNRTIATVRLPDARRRTLRNDLALTLRAPLLPGLDAPLVFSTNWTAQTLTYRGPDTLRARTDRYSGYLRQDVTLGPQTLQAELGATLDRVIETNAWSGVRTRRRLHATLRDSIGLGATALVLDGGVHVSDAQTHPSVALQATRPWGPVRLTADARLAGPSAAWIEVAGFGAAVQPVDRVPASRTLYGALGLDAALGAFAVRLTGFAHAIERPIALYATDTPDVLAAQVSDAPFQRAGATLEVAWRRRADAGLYGRVQATGLEFLNADAAETNARVAETLPRAYGHGRLGARFVAFAGDLNADLYLEGRAWTAMRSRQFHPPTGRLAVPPAGAPVLEGAPLTVGPSGTLDVTLEAGIRDATLFFGFDNVLSGTQLQPGAFVVPVYPLPERRFRLGVFWPIQE